MGSLWINPQPGEIWERENKDGLKEAGRVFTHPSKNQKLFIPLGGVPEAIEDEVSGFNGWRMLKPRGEYFV